jgi:hypothetical protein
MGDESANSLITSWKKHSTQCPEMSIGLIMRGLDDRNAAGVEFEQWYRHRFRARRVRCSVVRERLVDFFSVAFTVAFRSGYC